jgi:hypothetical protein
VTVVRPAPAVVEDFVVVRQTQDGTEAVQRPQGSSGDEDGPTDPETVQVALDFSPEAAADRTDQESHAPTPGSETGTGSPASATPATTGPDDGSPVDQDTTPAGSSTEGSPSVTSTEGSPPAASTEGSPSAAGTTPATSTTPDASPEGSPSAASPTPAASTTRDQGPTGQGRHPSDSTTLDGTVPDGSAPPG